MLAYAGVSPDAYASGQNFIYIAGAWSAGWYPPITENASVYEDYKLYETEEGSNIYEGSFYMTSSYFRFYTSLVPVSELETEHEAYYMNVIRPTGERQSDTAMDKLGKSEVCRQEAVFLKWANYADGSFRIPDFTSGGYYRFRVDMNAGMVYAIPTNAVVVQVNDTSVPTLETASNFTNYWDYCEYIPAGDLKFRLYDFYTGMWSGADASDPVVKETGNNVYLQTVGSAEPATFFDVQGWTGGVLSFNSKTAVSISANMRTDYSAAPAGVDAETLYLIGDFCGWNFDSAIQVARQADSETVYNFTIPAGAKEFLLTSEANWAAQFIFRQYNDAAVSGDGGVEISATTDYSSPNFTFSQALPADMEATFDLESMTLTLPASAAEYAVEDCLYVVTSDNSFQPWKGASNAVLDEFQKLSKVSDGVYEGAIKVSDGDCGIYFVSELAAQGFPNTVICPPSQRNLSVVGGAAYSTAVVTTADKAGAWIREGWDGGDVKVTVTTGSQPVEVKFEFPEESGTSCRYLVGQPEGWAGPIEGNKAHYESWMLKQTTNGGYYGSFEIAAGDAMFRFYSALEGWESNSWGCQEADSPVSYYDFTGSNGYETFSSSFVYGKGSWSFPNWEGGTMYIYIDPAASSVTFSRNPIEAAGEILPDQGGSINIKESMYAYLHGEYKEFTKTAEGVYTGRVSIYSDEDEAELRFFTKQLPIATDEAEWAGSYALSAPSDGYTFEFDELGVAEATFTLNNEVTSAPANTFRIEQLPDHFGSYYVTVDLNTNKIYLEDVYSVYYLVGGLTDGKVPTYETRSEFKEFAIGCYSGRAVNIPAGKFDFSYYRIAEGNLYTSQQDVEFGDDHIAIGNDINYGFMHSRCVNTGWTGGNVFIGTGKMMDLTSADRIYVTGNYIDGPVTLAATATGSAVFSGNVDCKKIDNPDLWQIIQFYLNQTDDYDRNIEISSDTHWTNLGITLGEGNEILDFSTGHAEARLGANSARALNAPTLIEGGTLKLTVDLSAMHLSADLVEGEPASTYQIFDNQDETGIDGETAYPSPTVPGVATATVADLPAGDVGFNISTAEGGIIAPAADEEITFDEFGTWTGSYTEPLIIKSKSRASLRAASSAQGKWCFNNPSDGTVSVMINEKDKTITVFAASHNKTYFVIPSVDWVYSTRPVIENIDLLKGNAIRETSEGIYEGEADLPEGGNIGLYLTSSLTGSVVPRHYSSSTFEINADNSEATLPVGEMDGSLTPWTVVSTVKKVTIKLDTAEYALTLGQGSVGVENVAADRDITIVPGRGRITVTSPFQTTLQIYSVSGMLVKTATINEGVTVIDLPAGIYIANRTKLAVR